MAENYTTRRATRLPVPLLLGFAGGTGSGKTYSMLRCARGIAGPQGKIIGIDTENGRMSHYADEFEFDVMEIRPPFTPDNYLGALKAAEKQKPAVILLDSVSHEWAGDGGCLEMHEDIVQRMSKGDSDKAEKVNALAWADPKRAHRKMMAHIIQSPVHILFGLRAEQKLKVIKETGSNGKEYTKFIDAGWQPICEKHFMYEMTASVMLDPEKRGIPIHVKVGTKLAKAFDTESQIDEKTGQLLLEWSKAKPAAGAETAKLILRDPKGGELKRLERQSAWLDSFETMLNEAGKGETAGELWDQNMDVFYAIQKHATDKENKPALERCNGIGRLVGELTAPPAGAKS